MTAAAAFVPLALRGVAAGVAATAAAITVGAAVGSRRVDQKAKQVWDSGGGGGGGRRNTKENNSERGSGNSSSCGEETIGSSTSPSKLDRSAGALEFDWAIVFKLSEEAVKEAAWASRTGPEQIEYVDEMLYNTVRSSAFPRHLLDLIIFESWLEFRTAILNSVIELLTMPNIGLECQLFRSVGGGRDAGQASLLVLLKLPDRAARRLASKLGHQLPLDKDVWRSLGLPPPPEGGLDYTPGFLRYDEKLMAHYEDVHDKPLYQRRSQTGIGVFRHEDRVRLMSQALQEHIDLPQLVGSGILTAAFPLHSSLELQRLRHEWARLHLVWSWAQPLEKIHEYFGEQVAFYFAWLGFQAKMLSILAIAGGLVEAWAFVHGWDAALHTACGCAVVLWANVYYRMWRRTESKLHSEWAPDVDVDKSTSQENPNYIGEWVMDPVTGGQRKRYPRRKQIMWRLLSHLVTVLFIGLSIFVVSAVFMLRTYLESPSGTPEEGPLQYKHLRVTAVISTLNTLQIVILEALWLYLAPGLVELENHLTQDGRRNALIWKMFLVRAINAFGAMCWIAFVKTADQCVDKDCMGELRMQLASVFFAYQGLTVWSEVILPLLCFKYQLAREDAALAKETGLVLRQRSYIERQAKMDEYDWQAAVQDYMSVTLQTGLVLLFFSVLPSLALLALGSHLVQIRADAWKLCSTQRRPFPAAVTGVGAWNEVMELLARLSVIWNASLIIFTSEFETHRSQAEKWLLLVLAERLAMFTAHHIGELMPDRSHHVDITRRRHAYMMERVQEERIGCKMCSGEAERGHEAIDELLDCAVAEQAEGAAKQMPQLSRPLPGGGFDPASLPRCLLDHHLVKHLRRAPDKMPAHKPRKRRHRHHHAVGPEGADAGDGAGSERGGAVDGATADEDMAMGPSGSGSSGRRPPPGAAVGGEPPRRGGCLNCCCSFGFGCGRRAHNARDHLGNQLASVVPASVLHDVGGAFSRQRERLAPTLQVPAGKMSWLAGGPPGEEKYFTYDG